MRKLLTLCLFLLMLSAAAIAGQAPAEKTAAGWQALEQGDADRAASLFYEALRTNPRDAVALFGAGASAHLLGRSSDAADNLKRALALNPKLTGAAELLGQIQYRQGETEEAIGTYERALASVEATAQPQMRKRLEDWRREAVLNGSLAERNGARFSIVFDGQSDSTLAARAMAILDRAFWRIGEKIGTYPSNRIFVTLYTERQFRDITQVPAWSSGAFDGKIRIPVRGVSQSSDAFDRVLVHELTHAIIDAIAPRGVPAWLHEGLAGYFEGRDPALAQRRLQALGVVLPLDVLQDSFTRFDAPQAAIAYEESLFIADDLARRLGTRMVILLQGLGNGRTLDESLGLLGMRAADFEAEVTRRLRR